MLVQYHEVACPWRSRFTSCIVLAKNLAVVWVRGDKTELHRRHVGDGGLLVLTAVRIVIAVHFFAIHFVSLPYFSSSLPVVTQIRGQIAGLPPLLPATVYSITTYDTALR